MEERLGPEHLDELVFAHLRRDYAAIDVRLTVGEALQQLQQQQTLGEQIVYFYVVDDQNRLQGIVPTRRLLTSDRHTPVASIMVTDVVTLPANATVRDASNMFLEHRLLAFPVVDTERRLHGIVDVSIFTRELADIANRQTAREVFQLIGIHLLRAAGPWEGFKDRFPWLLANVSGGLLAAFVASRYEAVLETAVVLALFIPVVLALAESVSIQSVTLTLESLRGHAGSLIPPARGAGKEFGTAILLGLACGGLVGGLGGAFARNIALSVTLVVAITLSMITACLLGIVLPAALHFLRRDPRVAAGPVVLALADLATLIAYFSLAQALF